MPEDPEAKKERGPAPTDDGHYLYEATYGSGTCPASGSSGHVLDDQPDGAAAR